MRFRCTFDRTQEPIAFILIIGYSLLHQTQLFRLGDGVCDGGQFFTEMCSYDEFDCQDLRSRVGSNGCDFEALANLVDVNHIPRFGDGICDSGAYNNAECLFEDGDCIECNARVHDVLLTGDGVCHGGAHNSQVCNWDAGDCYEFNEKYPLCMVNKTLVVIQNNATMKHVPIIGDGICNSGLYNNENCGYEDGDCHACNTILDEKGLDRMKVRSVPTFKCFATFRSFHV